MGRVDDKEGEALVSEAEEEKDTSEVKDKNDEGKESSDAEEDMEQDMSEEEEYKDMDKDTSDVEYSDTNTRKKYKCTEPGCNLRFLRPSRLTWHLRKHNNERPFTCDREGCNRAYTNASHLKRHLNTTHKLITETYECKECGMDLSSLSSLNRHMKKIHDPTRLTCKECGVKFRKKHCYNEHLSMHAGVAMHKCDICNQTFTTLRLYKKHKRVHESLKSYACPSAGCTETFDKWSKLKKHMKANHEFDHKCNECSKKFKRKAYLRDHSLCHTFEGPVEICPYENCPRFYSHSRNLDNHILVAHQGHKFICDTCQKAFTAKSTIARHIRVIHEGQPSGQLRKRKRYRRIRKDAGIRKRSMVSKLCGLNLPINLDKRILHAEPRIKLDGPDATVPSPVNDAVVESEIITGRFDNQTSNGENDGFMVTTMEANVEVCPSALNTFQGETSIVMMEYVEISPDNVENISDSPLIFSSNGMEERLRQISAENEETLQIQIKEKQSLSMSS